MMKKIAILLLSLSLMPALAQAEALEGTVEAARSATLTAPYSGTVSGVDAKAGDILEAGRTLLSIGTTKVYAGFDGVVTAVFAEPGDAAADVQETYGALCYLERAERYRADCTTSGADSDNENKIIHAGERVFIRSMQNEDRTGEAVVTTVEGNAYALLVTAPGDLRLNDRVKVYRDDRYRSADCIGTGALSRIDPVRVTGEGSVLAVHAAPGQSVSRGDLLLELVPDALDGMRGGDGTVAMPQSGVVLSVAAQDGAAVAKDDVLLTYCPEGEIEVVCEADEDDLRGLSVGDAMRVTLDAYPDEPLNATVTAISGAGEDEGSGVTFDVTLSLEPNALARIGMSATAEKKASD